MIGLREQYILDVIEDLKLQRERTQVFLADAVQDYVDATGDNDMDAKTEALEETECYAVASTAIARAINYLKKAKEGKHD